MNFLKGKGTAPNFELFACSKETAGSSNIFCNSVNSQIDGPNFAGHQQDFLDEDFGLDDLEVMLNDDNQKPESRDFFSALKVMEEKVTEEKFVPQTHDQLKNFQNFEKFDMFFITNKLITAEMELDSSDSDEDMVEVEHI
jgi:hypothetical protein